MKPVGDFTMNTTLHIKHMIDIHTNTHVTNTCINIDTGINNNSKRFHNAGPRVFAVQEAGNEIADREALHCTRRIQSHVSRTAPCGDECQARGARMNITRGW